MTSVFDNGLALPATDWLSDGALSALVQTRASARSTGAPMTPYVHNLAMDGGGTASTDVRAYPRGAARVPTVSNVNLVRGDTRANLAIVRVGSDGRVRVRNSSGQLQLVADVAGYMVG